MPTRRDLFRAGKGVATAATVAVVGAVGTASASHLDQTPDHVTISYDQARLERYQPLLQMAESDRKKFLGLHGWIATSNEHDTDVMVYWAEYSHQSGWLGNRDSHYGDHEPVQVLVDSESGEVTRVRASVYHWLKGETTAAPMDGDNVRLKVINPWHQYSAADPDASVEQFAVEDLNDVYQAWLDNGLESDLLVGSSVNPWIMADESDWWQPDVAGVSRAGALYGAFKSAGIGTAGDLSK